MEESRIEKRDKKGKQEIFLSVGVGDVGDGAENRLEESIESIESTNKTLFIDHEDFISLLYWVLPYWKGKDGIRDGSEDSEKIRKKLGAVRVISHYSKKGDGEEINHPQIPFKLQPGTVLTYMGQEIKILIPIDQFSEDAYDHLAKRTVKSIDLRVVTMEFAEAFEARWKSIILRRPKGKRAA